MVYEICIFLKKDAKKKNVKKRPGIWQLAASGTASWRATLWLCSCVFGTFAMLKVLIVKMVFCARLFFCSNTNRDLLCLIEYESSFAYALHPNSCFAISIRMQKTVARKQIHLRWNTNREIICWVQYQCSFLTFLALV